MGHTASAQAVSQWNQRSTKVVAISIAVCILAPLVTISACLLFRELSKGDDIPPVVERNGVSAFQVVAEQDLAERGMLGQGRTPQS